MIIKKIPAFLCCAVLLGILSGCSQADRIPKVVKKEDISETSAESQAESAVNTESETETKSGKETTKPEMTAVTTAVSSETAETTTTAVSSTEDKKSSTTTTATQKSGTETTASTQTETVKPEETTVPPEEETDAPVETTQTETTAPAETSAPETDAPTEAETQAPELSMTVNYQGYDITIGESAADFISAVPAERSESAPSCYGNGENINYYYESEQVILYTWNENENYLAYGLDIYIPGIVSVDGMDIGSPASFDGEKSYDLGNGCSVLVTAEGGTVTIISYNKDLPQIN